MYPGSIIQMIDIFKTFKYGLNSHEFKVITWWLNCFRQIEWWVSTKKKVIKTINIYSCIILGHIQPNVRTLGTPVFHGIFNRRSVRKQRNHIGQDKPTRYNRYRTKVGHVHARIWFSRIRIGKSRGMWNHFYSITYMFGNYILNTYC